MSIMCQNGVNELNQGFDTQVSQLITLRVLSKPININF